MSDFISAFAEVLDCDVADLEESTVFRDHMNWDSLALLSTIAMIDENYGVVIPHAKLEELMTIGDLMQFISEKRGA